MASNSKTTSASKPTRSFGAVIEDGCLIITVPMNATPERSTSGKTMVVASSHGNIKTDVTVDGKPVMIGVNAYIK